LEAVDAPALLVDLGDMGDPFERAFGAGSLRSQREAEKSGTTRHAGVSR